MIRIVEARKGMFHTVTSAYLLGEIFSVFLLLCGSASGFDKIVDCKYPDKQSLSEHRRSIGAEWSRKDPFFKTPYQLYTPLLFAHRGGRLEAPESTKKAFNHALFTAGADVLELDVQLTADRKIVVWHGLRLDNVHIESVDPDPKKRPKGRRRIDDFDWKELEGKAWVADPNDKNLVDVRDHEDKSERGLMLLTDFLEAFPCAPLNIELKSTFKNDGALAQNIERFIEILGKGKKNRTIVVVSGQYEILKEFRKQSGNKYTSGISGLEQLFFPFFAKSFQSRALETTYDEFWASEKRIKKIRSLRGATYVFITKFGAIPALDGEDFNPDDLREKIFELLDRGVDGIMTDRPKVVRNIMDQWIKDKITHKRAE